MIEMRIRKEDFASAGLLPQACPRANAREGSIPGSAPHGIRSLGQPEIPGGDFFEARRAVVDGGPFAFAVAVVAGDTHCGVGREELLEIVELVREHFLCAENVRIEAANGLRIELLAMRPVVIAILCAG